MNVLGDGGETAGWSSVWACFTVVFNSIAASRPLVWHESVCDDGAEMVGSTPFILHG